MERELLKVKKYKAGYEVRLERIIGVSFEVESFDNNCSPELVSDVVDLCLRGSTPRVMESAYTPTGDYIGSPLDAHRLCKTRGIRPQKTDPSHEVCSIGFCEGKQKWYGWSHRAICGFGIGDEVKEGDCTASSGWTEEYLLEHPEEDTSLPVGFKATDLVDAKKMAIAFAASVS